MQKKAAQIVGQLARSNTAKRYATTRIRQQRKQELTRLTILRCKTGLQETFDFHDSRYWYDYTHEEDT